MRHKKVPRDTTRASVKKEMAQPRMARSARIAQQNLDTARVPDRANHWHRDLRIENSLTDENGDEVKLKKGAHVEVTVAAKSVRRQN